LQQPFQYSTLKTLIFNYFHLVLLSFFLWCSCTDKENVSQGGFSQDIVTINDTVTVNKLLKIENPFYSKTPELVISYNTQAIELSKKIGYKEGQINGILNIGISYLSTGDYKKAKTNFLEALQYSEEEMMQASVARSLGCLGMLSEKESNYAEGLAYYARSKEAFLSVEDSIGVIKCHLNISNIYKVIGERAKAISFIVEGLEIAEAIENDVFIGTCLNNLSILYQYIGKNEKAIPYFFQALEISKKSNDSVSMAKVLNNIGVSYQELKKKDLAIKYYLQAAEIKEKISNKSDIAGTWINIGSLMLEAKDYTSALNHYTKALRLSEEDQNELLNSEILRDIGEAYIGLNQYEFALLNLNRSLAIAEKFGMKERKYEALNSLTELYSKMDNFEKAFEYSQTLSVFNDSLIKLHNDNEIAEIKTRYETDKKEQEIVKLNNEKKYTRLVNIFLICFSVMLLITLFFIFFSLKTRITKNKEIAKYQQSLVERKLTILKLEQTNLEQNLKHSEKELVDMALYIVQKIEFLETLQSEIKTMQKDSGSSNQEITKKLSSLISHNLRLDKEQVDFQLHLEKVNQSFYKKLEQKFPKITQNELKLSALLRSNFTSKDIATIYNISPSSVDMNRYRLRKKFNLTNEENLSHFLKNI